MCGIWELNITNIHKYNKVYMYTKYKYIYKLSLVILGKIQIYLSIKNKINHIKKYFIYKNYINGRF